MAIRNPENLINSLRELPAETEWAEFKKDNEDPQSIGKYVSALANSAIYCGEQHCYLVFGIENKTHNLIGTNVRLARKSVGNEPFLHWLNKKIKPPLNIEHSSVRINENVVEILRIDPAYVHPVRFDNSAYIRIESSLHPLHHHPGREAAIWQAVNRFSFERSIAASRLTRGEIISSFFVRELVNGLTESRGEGDLIGYLEQEDSVVAKNLEGGFDVYNLFVMVAAQNLTKWPGFERKGIRVIGYKDTTKLDTVYDAWGRRGYYNSFENALANIMTLIPYKEEMRHGIRQVIYEIPQVAVREILGNAIIHQDFTDTSRGPVVEVFRDRIRITNPGKPLVAPDRFIDTPSRSRNSAFSDIMRRLGVCEERGSGIDRAFNDIEKAGLPPPLIQVVEDSTVVTIFGPRKFADLTKEDRLRACYWHACLGVEQNRFMSNKSLRHRFRLSDKQYPQVSEVIRDAWADGLIRPLSEDQGNRNARYVPYWY